MVLAAQQDYINILGQNFTIWGLLVLCVVALLITLISLILIIGTVVYRNINRKNSDWKKFKVEKVIYETEEQIMKMVLIIEKTRHQGGE